MFGAEPGGVSGVRFDPTADRQGVPGGDRRVEIEGDVERGVDGGAGFVVTTGPHLDLGEVDERPARLFLIGEHVARRSGCDVLTCVVELASTDQEVELDEVVGAPSSSARFEQALRLVPLTQADVQVGGVGDEFGHQVSLPEAWPEFGRVVEDLRVLRHRPASNRHANSFQQMRICWYQVARTRQRAAANSGRRGARLRRNACVARTTPA